MRGVVVGAGGPAGAAHRRSFGASVTEVLLAQRRQALLLGNRVDVGADDERNKVEEGHPCVLGKELLGKGQAERRCNPADAHNFPETNLDSRPHVVEALSASNNGHGDEVDGILDRSNL